MEWIWRVKSYLPKHGGIFVHKLRVVPSKHRCNFWSSRRILNLWFIFKDDLIRNIFISIVFVSFCTKFLHIRNAYLSHNWSYINIQKRAHNFKIAVILLIYTDSSQKNSRGCRSPRGVLSNKKKSQGVPAPCIPLTDPSLLPIQGLLEWAAPDIRLMLGREHHSCIPQSTTSWAPHWSLTFDLLRRIDFTFINKGEIFQFPHQFKFSGKSPLSNMFNWRHFPDYFWPHVPSDDTFCTIIYKIPLKTWRFSKMATSG